MNRNIILIIVCCLCTIIYSCNNEAVQIHSDASYIVNIDSAEDRGVFYLSSIVKSVRPILLEEPDYALIGDIYQMDIVDNHIFILDALVAKKMFMYDMNGKFLRQIGAMGEGPDEYRALADFCVDTERKEIYLLDRYKKLLKFNIRDGKHLETVNLPHGDFWYDELAYVDNSLYMDINHEELDVSNNRLLKLDLKTGKLKKYLNNTTYCAGKPRRIAAWFSKSHQPKYSQPKYLGFYTNTMYVCKNDSVYSYLTIKSKNWVQNHEIPDDGDSDKDNELTEKKCAYWLSKYYENDTCIYFQYRQGKQTYQIVYNKDTQATYRYRSVVNDIEYDLQQKHEFLDLYDLKYANSRHAYGVRMPSNTASAFLNKNLFSPELAKQMKQFKLEEEGWILIEYELK